MLVLKIKILSLKDRGMNVILAVEIRSVSTENQPFLYLISVVKRQDSLCLQPGEKRRSGAVQGKKGWGKGRRSKQKGGGEGCESS